MDLVQTSQRERGNRQRRTARETRNDQSSSPGISGYKKKIIDFDVGALLGAPLFCLNFFKLKRAKSGILYEEKTLF
jgi:hypothetical protein